MVYFANWIKIERNFCWTSNVSIQKKQKPFGGNKVFDNNKNLNEKKFNKGKCEPCFTRSVNLCSKQLKTCSTFQSAFNKSTFLIRHNVTCKSNSVTYLMECRLCKKSQYVGKSKYSLNLRMNTHRSDVWRTDSPPCDKHFQMPVHNSTVHAKFTIIKEVYKSLSKLKICSLLEQREDFWILKLQILYPQGLNISYWVHLVAILTLVSTHLLVGFILYRILPLRWVMLNLFDVKYNIINNTYLYYKKMVYEERRKQ